MGAESKDPESLSLSMLPEGILTVVLSLEPPDWNLLLALRQSLRTTLISGPFVCEVVSLSRTSRHGMEEGCSLGILRLRARDLRRQ